MRGNGMILEIDDVRRAYPGRRTLFARPAPVRAVDGVTLSLAPGRTLGVVGESGCGKSTTGRLALGLEPPDSGTVRFEGAAMPAPGSAAWRRMRARLQLVPQDPLGALDRRLTIAAQVEEPLLIHALPAGRDRVMALLDQVGLRPDQAARHPHALSGGQRQRAVLARALATDPALLVLDEPVSALDVSIQAGIVNLLQDLQAARGLAMLFISHDLKVVRQVSHEVAVMYLGRVVEQGEPDAIFREPAHPYARALVSAIPVPGPRLVERIVLTGDPPNPADRPTGCAFHPRCVLAVSMCRVDDPVLKARGDGRLVACHVAHGDAGGGTLTQSSSDGKGPLVSRRLALGLAAVALPRVAIGQPARPVLTVAVQKIANTGLLDPLREQSSNASERYLGLVLETPILRDGQGRAPGLAESWRRVDARTLDIVLRPGVAMHDGRTMTAEDVAWSFGPRMFGGDTPGDAQAVAKRHWPALERVEATGPLTLRLVNRTPDLTLEGRLAAGGSEVVSAASHQAAGWAAAARKPVGTGAYRVASFRPDVELVLEAHDAYWGGRPPLAGVRFLEVPEASARVDGLRSGQYGMATDINPDQIVDVEKDRRLHVVGGPVPNHRIVVFDHHHPALKDPRVRLAMAHAVDGAAIAEALWAGRTVVPAGLQWAFYGPMFVEGWTVPPYDPAKAKTLLADAGYRGAPIPYRIRNNYYTAEVATAQVLVEMWRAVGLNVEIEVKENWSQVLDTSRPRGVRDWSNSAVFDDPVSSIVNQHGPNGAQQTNGEWSNAEMNLLSVQLEQGTDMGERRRVFARMLQICEREDPAYIVLHQNASFVAKRRDLNWRPSPSFFLDLTTRGLG